MGVDVVLLENVAMGDVNAGATREMVEETCRVALFHEFVRDLEDGRWVRDSVVADKSDYTPSTCCDIVSG